MSAPRSGTAMDTDPMVRVLETEPAVLVAYLFGSTARRTATSLSDLDMAVLVREGSEDPALHLRLLDRLQSVFPQVRLDLVILNGAPVALAYRVLRDGELIVSKDESARIRHWTSTVDRYLDMEPMRRVLAEGTKHRIEEGRFGRP